MNFQRAIPSPCIGICRLDATGHCDGCHRTGSEIAAWLAMSDDARSRLMDEVLPARAEAHAQRELKLLARIHRAVHPLSPTPTHAAFNRADYDDLLPAAGMMKQAAVLVGLILRPDGWQVMLTLRTEHLRDHAGQVSFPGGRIEADDADPVAAALREAHEEIGLAARQIEPIGYLDPLDTITGFHVYPVVARIASDYKPKLDPREVAQVFEVSLDYLMDAKSSRELVRDFAGRQRRYHEYGYAPHRIWGATAAMLVNLRERLEAVQ